MGSSIQDLATMYSSIPYTVPYLVHRYHDFASIPSCDLKYQCLPASCPSYVNTFGQGPFYTAQILPAKGPQQKSQAAWAGANTYCSARSVWPVSNQTISKREDDLDLCTMYVMASYFT